MLKQAGDYKKAFEEAMVARGLEEASYTSQSSRPHCSNLDLELKLKGAIVRLLEGRMRRYRLETMKWHWERN